jgi:glycogen(starch) synthase
MNAADITPRRVLMTADVVGGVWSYALELARGLVGSGCEVVLATLGPPTTPEQAAHATRIGVELVHGGYALEWMPGADRDLEHAGAWMLDLEARFRPEIVHLNGFAHATLPWQVPTLVVAHSCVLSWWRAVKGEDAPAGWAAYRRRTRAGLQAADLVVAPTRAFLDQIQALYGPLNPTRCIWNGCDPPETPAGDKEPLFFSAGRVWDEAKNLGALAAIADRLSWPVSIAGLGAPAGAAARRSAVQWLGLLPSAAMRDWYARASVVVLPSRYEPFGLAALEAGLAGCALVLGDIPTLRELWDGAALFVPPDDNEALVSALNRLAGDPSLLWLLGGQARSRAARYSAGRMTAGYLEAYADLLVPQHRGDSAVLSSRARAFNPT